MISPYTRELSEQLKRTQLEYRYFSAIAKQHYFEAFLIQLKLLGM